MANPLWGAPRIHGELLKIGIDIGQTTVAKYMEKRRSPPSQGWKTFLRNHAAGIASIDSSSCRPLLRRKNVKAGRFGTWQSQRVTKARSPHDLMSVDVCCWVDSG
jgi:hypothetical protein